MSARIPWGRVAAFALVGLALHLGLRAIYVSLVRDEHKAARSDQSFLERAPERVDLLVCGDSHPRSAIDPLQVSDRTVNIAVGGEHYLKTWYRLRYLLERTDREIGALLLPLDAASFSSWHADNFSPEYVWGRYVDFLEVGRVRGEPWAYVGRALKAGLFPYAGELRTFNQLRTRRFGFGEELPFGSFAAMSSADRRASALQAAKEHLQNADLMDPGLRWAFDQLVSWADAHDVRVVLVGFPVTRDYERWVTRTKIRKRLHDQVVTPFLRDPDHMYIDHHDIFGKRDELFADPHHLNAMGRTLYSRYLKQVLLEQGVLRPDLGG